MKTSTLFVVGLVVGAAVVFLLRALTLEDGGAGPSPKEHSHQGEPASKVGGTDAEANSGDAHSGHAAHGASVPTLLVRLGDDGAVESLRMQMPDGSLHALRPDAKMPMQEMPARIAGREGEGLAHLHPRPDGDLEVTVRDAAGDLLVQEVLPAESARPPENEICPVMGNPIDPEIFVDYEGRRIGFCCPGCDKVFLEDPDTYLKKVDAELAARAASADGASKESPEAKDEAALDPNRPPENTICPVMGNPVDPEVWVDYEGRRIGFCCPGCDKVFLEDPETYLKKVDEELKQRGEK